MFSDIRSITLTKAWLPIVTAACLVDTAGLFVWRFTAEPDGPINVWYDKFGLAAYNADVLSIILGVMLTQIVTTFIGGPWNPILFVIVAVIIQMVHDVLFAVLVVPAVPKGQNAIMDLMRKYTHIDFPQGILIVDAVYMILASLLAMLLVSVNPSFSWITLIITLYATMYVLYTKPKPRS